MWQILTSDHGLMQIDKLNQQADPPVWQVSNSTGRIELQKPKCRISIIIPVYSPVRIIKKCLESISKQTINPIEVVLVNNGQAPIDTDDMPKNVCVKILQLPCNVGFGPAVNYGIRQSCGNLILVLNDDTELHRDCIRFVLQSANEHPGYGSYALKVYKSHRSQEIDSAGLMFSDRGYGNRSNAPQYIAVSKPTEVFSACGAAAVYKREAVREVGCFNDSFFFLFEDLELGFRLQLSGYKCLFLPDALVYHHGGFSSKDLFGMKVREGIKNAIMTLLMCMPSTLLKENWGKILKFYGRLIFTIAREGYGKDLLIGLTRLSLSLGYCLRVRADIQKRATADIAYLKSILYRGPICVNLPEKRCVL